MNNNILSKKERIRSWLQDKPVGQAFQPAVTYGKLQPLLKEDLSIVQQYKRRLPHWEKEGSTYFVTFRVNKTLGKPFLKNPTLADVVEEALWFGYGERYILDAYVVMPDHVHLLLTPLYGWKLSRILQGIKGYTSREINKLLNRKAPFWQDESFDHLVRNEASWIDKFEYIHNNPVNARLVGRPEDYKFSSLVTIHSKGRLESLPHNRIRKGYRLIDHTADLGIHVFGNDPEELFGAAAQAMFDQITDTKALKGIKQQNIKVKGTDWPDLMVNWLRELLSLWTVKELLVKTVEILFLSETALSAVVKADTYNPESHIIKTEIKAVTYHQSSVESGLTGWESKIIFDI